MVEHNPGAFSVAPEVARINASFGPNTDNGAKMPLHNAIRRIEATGATSHPAEDLGIADPIYKGVFPARPMLDFDPLPPPHPKELDGKKPNVFDLSRMKPHENGNLRIFANYALPFSPSETSPEITRILRAMVRQEKPKPIGYIAYEADVDVEVIVSFLLPESEATGSNAAFSDLVEIHEESPENPHIASGEIYVAMPKLRNFVLETVNEMELDKLDYTDEELLQIHDNLKILNVLPEAQELAAAAD